MQVRTATNWRSLEFNVFPSQSVVFPVIATGGLGFTTTVTGAIAG
jgi:hypothetical protein